MKRKICLLCMLAVALLSCFNVKAQQYYNSPIAQYYRNGYLWNPAYAGDKSHSTVYALLNNSWIGFDGAPSLVVFSGDFAFGKSSGAGLKFISDKAGLLQRTTIGIDYSYTLHFSATNRLRMGASLGLYTERVNNASSVIDPLVTSYNSRTTVADGNFGAVYETGEFSFGAVSYNLRTTFQKSSEQQANVAKANFMASYNFKLPGEKMAIKPLVSYKLFSEGGNLFTIGSQFEYNKLFNTSVLWQNTGSFIGSLGVYLYKALEVNFAYGSNNKYGYGQQYEIGLGVALGK